MRFSLTKADRIRKRPEFLALSGSGRQLRTEFFIAVVAPGTTGRSRLGITVSRKVGGSVQRNRLKRLVREYFRLNRHWLKGCWDINLIVRKAAAEKDNKAIFRALQDVFEKI